MKILRAFRVTGTILLCLTALSCSSTIPVTAEHSAFKKHRYEELTQATRSFLDSLDEEQRSQVVLDFDNTFRTRAFCYVLARCSEEYVGLRMEHLTVPQKMALHNLLMKSFSGFGYARAVQIMNREWLVEEMENAHRKDPARYPTVGSPLVDHWTPPLKRAAPQYYIAFFGNPFGQDPWGIRFEGHHLGLNLTLKDNEVSPSAGSAPFFFGSSPMIVPEAPEHKRPTPDPYPDWRRQEGQQLLHRETWLARSFLNSLDKSVLGQGEWSELPDVVLAGGNEVPLDAASFLEGQKPGIRVSELNELQQNLLFEFALEFLQMESSHHTNRSAFRDNLSKGRVWWFGDIKDEHEEFYFRVQSNRYLIEILQSDTFGVVSEVKGNHVHASFRDLQSDWDHNALGAHIKKHHVH